MKYFNQGVMSLCLVAGLMSGGQALAQVTNTTPNGDSGMISTPSLQEDTNLSTPTNGATETQTSTETLPETSTNVEVDMPDINLPAGTPEREISRTESTTERTLIQTDNNDAEGGINTLYLAIIGIVAVFLVAVIGMLASRRETPYQP